MHSKELREERQKIMQRLKALTEQVQMIASAKDIALYERGRRVIELNREWLKEFQRLKADPPT